MVFLTTSKRLASERGGGGGGIDAYNAGLYSIPQFVIGEFSFANRIAISLVLHTLDMSRNYQGSLQ